MDNLLNEAKEIELYKYMQLKNPIFKGQSRVDKDNMYWMIFEDDGILYKTRNRLYDYCEPIREHPYYRMMINNIRAYFDKEKDKNIDIEIDCFEFSEILAICTGKLKEDIVIDIMKTKN